MSDPPNKQHHMHSFGPGDDVGEAPSILRKEMSQMVVEY